MLDVFAPVRSNPRNPWPTPKRYNRWLEADQRWLLWWLDMYEIRFSELDLVGDAMAGHPHTELDAIILRVKRARAAPRDEGPRASAPQTRQRAEALRASLRPPRSRPPRWLDDAPLPPDPR